MQSVIQTHNQADIILLIPHQNMSYQSLYWQHTVFISVQLHLYKYHDFNRTLGIFAAYHVVCFGKRRYNATSIEAINKRPGYTVTLSSALTVNLNELRAVLIQAWKKR